MHQQRFIAVIGLKDMTRAKRKHSPARVPPQTEEQLCRAVKRLHAFSEAESTAREASQDLSTSVGLERSTLGNTEGVASATATVHRLPADGVDSALAKEDPSSSDAAVTLAAVTLAGGALKLRMISKTRQEQGLREASSLHPDIEADLSGKEREKGAASRHTAAEPAAKPQQAEQTREKVSDRQQAAEAGPWLAAESSQLPERLRHIRFSGKEDASGKERRRTSLDSIEEPITPGRTEKAGPGTAASRPDPAAAESGGDASFESLYEEANKLLKNLHFQRLMRHAPASPDRTDARKEASL